VFAYIIIMSVCVRLVSVMKMNTMYCNGLTSFPGLSYEDEEEKRKPWSGPVT
jgi:hypothetical protein